MDRKADYYGLLGLNRQAKPDEIRAAFRNLALKFHPDRNPDAAAQQRFRQISEAYDILSDLETRKIYDQIGSEGLRGQTVRDYRTNDYPYVSIYRQMFGDGTPEAIFGGESPFGDASAAGMGGRGANLRMEIEISTGDAVFGIQKSVTVIRHELCGKCGGSKAKPGSWPAACSNCDGNGVVRGGPGLFHQKSMPCPTCTGRGKRIVIACDGCKGAGTVRVKRRLEVVVPAKTKDGERIRMKGEGDQSHWGGPPGDLAIDIRIRKGTRP